MQDDGLTRYEQGKGKELEQCRWKTMGLQEKNKTRASILEKQHAALKKRPCLSPSGLSKQSV